MTTLDTSVLYGNRPAVGSFQQISRERMTLTAYNNARDNRAQVIIWSVVAVVHIMIVLFSLGLPSFTAELTAYPQYILGLAIWLAGDIIFLAFAPKLYSHYQLLMDRLEGKVQQR